MYGEEIVCVYVCVVIEIGLAANSSRVNIFMLAARSTLVYSYRWRAICGS